MGKSDKPSPFVVSPLHDARGRTDFLPRQRPVLDPVRFRRIRPQPPPLVCLICLEIPLEPLHVAVALERKDVSGQTIQKPAVMADDHRAPSEFNQRLFQRPKRVHVQVTDEPTNDLDVDTVRALEEALIEFAGCAVIISHDRWFLDRLATHILAFEGGGPVEWFEGNSQAYEADKRGRLGADATEPHSHVGAVGNLSQPRASWRGETTNGEGLSDLPTLGGTHLCDRPKPAPSQLSLTM